MVAVILVTRKWFAIIPAIVNPINFIIDAPFGRFTPKDKSIFLLDGKLHICSATYMYFTQSSRNQDVDIHGAGLACLFPLHIPQLAALTYKYRHFTAFDPFTPTDIPRPAISPPLPQQGHHFAFANTFTLQIPHHSASVRDLIQCHQWLSDGFLPILSTCAGIPKLGIQSPNVLDWNNDVGLWARRKYLP